LNKTFLLNVESPVLVLFVTRYHISVADPELGHEGGGEGLGFIEKFFSMGGVPNHFFTPFPKKFTFFS